MTTEPTLEDYKKFFDETPVALIRTDLRTGEFLMANKYAARMFGFDSVDDLKKNGRTVDFYPPEDRKRLIVQIRRKGIVEDYEIKLQLPERVIWVSARLRINCGGSCIEGSLIDITSYVEAREQYLGRMKDIAVKLDKKLISLAS